MLVWCGKQYLAQKDAVDPKIELDHSVAIKYVAVWGGHDGEINADSAGQLIEAGDGDWEEE